jgi:peptidoglycan hydrolase-like protein with peptidoglycan-binding domain
MVLSLATAVLEAGDADTLAEAAIDVTGEGVTCTTYDDCLDKLESGDDINYDGVSGQIALDDNGDPTFARFTSAQLEGAAITNIESADVDITVLRRQFEAYAAASLNTQIQQALTFLGFYDGPIDGLDSPELREAIAAFQTSVGLPPTGVWDEATDAAMREVLGDKADALAASTRETQILMTELGFYTGPIDGIWTQELTDSIKALQRELGVPETGVLDTATLTAIYLLGVESGTPDTTVPPATTTPPATTAPPATTVPPTTAPPATTVPPETTVPPTTAPPTTPLPTLTEALQANPEYSDYVRLLEAAEFPDDFDRLVKYTVFAPTNAAFADAGYDIDAILAAYAQDPAALFEILIETVALGVIERTDLVDGGTIEMLSGNTFPVTNDGTNITVDGLPVPPPPTEASNGIIHTLGALRPA